jgi:predicted transcriptional regulator
MKKFEEKLTLAKILLFPLSRQPLRRKQLETIAFRKSATHATFEPMFNFLVQKGLIQKSEQRHTAPYTITEKGKKFLEGLP